MNSHVKITDLSQGHCLESLRSLSKEMSNSVAGSELSSQITSFSVCVFFCWSNPAVMTTAVDCVARFISKTTNHV